MVAARSVRRAARGSRHPARGTGPAAVVRPASRSRRSAAGARRRGPRRPGTRRRPRGCCAGGRPRRRRGGPGRRRHAGTPPWTAWRHRRGRPARSMRDSWSGSRAPRLTPVGVTSTLSPSRTERFPVRPNVSVRVNREAPRSAICLGCRSVLLGRRDHRLLLAEARTKRSRSPKFPDLRSRASGSCPRSHAPGHASGLFAVHDDAVDVEGLDDGSRGLPARDDEAPRSEAHRFDGEGRQRVFEDLGGVRAERRPGSLLLLGSGRGVDQNRAGLQVLLQPLTGLGKHRLGAGGPCRVESQRRHDGSGFGDLSERRRRTGTGQHDAGADGELRLGWRVVTLKSSDQ